MNATTTPGPATTTLDYGPCSNGGFPEWIGNGVCNDQNNNALCFWDGGDCCGEEVNKEFCKQCKW